MFTNSPESNESKVHPSDENLAGWLQSEIDAETASWIEGHLESCDQCAQRLESMPDPDAIVIQQLREAMRLSDGASPDRSQRDTVRGTIVDSTLNLRVDAAASGPQRLSSPHQRWRPIEMIGAGGIGHVWLTHDTLLDQHVALKCLQPMVAGSKRVLDRFLREAVVTARLNHPGVPQVFDLRNDGEASYYVMSLVEGRTLAEAIGHLHDDWKANREVPMDRLMGLLRDLVSVAKTVAYAHMRNIVHRDLKSENIILGDYGQVTLIDWGLAKVMSSGGDTILDSSDAEERDAWVSPFSDAAVTHQGAKLGTPCFMAPEQARGDLDAIDERTDVHGLACILYEMLTGQPPFSGASANEVIESVISRAPLPPDKIRQDVPAKLQNICMRGLQKNPDDRYASVNEFAEEIRRWTTTESDRQFNTKARARFFSLTKDLLVIHDFRNVIRWVNPAWRSLGWEPDELIGTINMNLTTEDRAEQVQEVIDLVRQGHSIEDIEVPIRCKDGSLQWFMWTASPVPDEDLVCVIGRNIDQRHRREERFMKMVEASLDALVVVNDDLTVFLVNSKYKKLLGFEADQIEGQCVSLMIPPQLRESNMARLRAIFASEDNLPRDIERDEIAYHRDGYDVPVRLCASLIETDDGRFLSTTLRRSVQT